LLPPAIVQKATSICFAEEDEFSHRYNGGRLWLCVKLKAPPADVYVSARNHRNTSPSIGIIRTLIQVDNGKLLEALRTQP
jgi:hypothetical protein